MLNTYIKNRGISETFIHDNNNNNLINQVNWDANYDGDIANISINTESNGKTKHFDIKLDNEDLANILNVESIDMPIDKRIKIDFDEYSYNNNNNTPYYIELPIIEFKPREPIQPINSINNRNISSPEPYQEFTPLLIDTNKHTPKKRKSKRKTHITYKLHKKTKTKTKSNRSKSSSRKKHKKHINTPFDLL